LILYIFDVIFEILYIGLIDEDDLTVLDVAIDRYFLVAFHEVDEVTGIVLVEEHDELVHANCLVFCQAGQSF